jgi:tetratricopeptide (TPR) repeat protein
VTAYSLATRLVPDRFHTYDDSVLSYRLASPIGYWNSLGLLAAMGVLVALGFVAHARRDRYGLASAIAVPIGLTTLYFTFSRGAWIALFVGVAVAVATDPRRTRLLWTSLIVSLPAAVCIAYGSTLDALTTEDAPTALAAQQGHRLAALVGASIGLTVIMAWGARAASRKTDVTARGRRWFALGLAAVAFASVVGGLASLGGPVSAVDDLKARFNAEPSTGAADLNERLFSVSGNGRSEQLRVAWSAGRERPLIGHGAGTFEYIWYRERPDLLVVRDAHSLYVETFAELGLIGVALLLGALCTLAAGAIRARRQRFVAVGLGVFAAWAAAASVDWHWEVVGVTMTALLAASAGLVASERRSTLHIRAPLRAVLVSAGCLLSLAAVWSLVGNQALFAGRDALARKDWATADDDARRAQALLFWSAEPKLVLGDAAAGLGDRDGALQAYREAVATDPESWVAWLRRAQVARGAERAEAYRRVQELNPREEGLPGE